MEPFLGEIRTTSFNFPPKGWALCNGQLLSINQNQALFSLVGTTYGGNGTTTFQLPNLQGRIPIHQGGSAVIGSTMGEANVTLSTSQIPSHSHSVSVAFASATSSDPTTNFPAIASSGAGPSYYLAPDVDMHPNAIQENGGGLAHPNMMPYTVVNYIIALVGVYPSRD